MGTPLSLSGGGEHFVLEQLHGREDLLLRQVEPLHPEGTVALSVDIITAQEIFRLTVAPSTQVAVLSDWKRGRVGAVGPAVIAPRKICGVVRLRALNKV